MFLSLWCIASGAKLSFASVLHSKLLHAKLVFLRILKLLNLCRFLARVCETVFTLCKILVKEISF